ncbi:YolD-like family protein [Peribacillus psychrosaccharolyticus]|uniref:YolD-like family protein n=1 Tax=Peribacillus psychrosaccharolyticus TaxID=1407 RepID=UPI003D2770E7
MLREHEIKNRPNLKLMLDERTLEQIGIVIIDSLKHNLPVRIIFWREERFIQRIGIVAALETHSNTLLLQLLSGEISIPKDSVVSAERI